MGKDELQEALSTLTPTLVAWRRELHRHPELGFEERWTSEFVESRLREIDAEVHSGLAETGLVGVIRAQEPRGPAVLLRADMDALPVQEVEGRPYGSTVPQRMHACGHDGHMAMLLGAATLLARRRERLARDVVLCFQPAEEGLGGAQRMIRDGALEIVEIGSVYALHLWSLYPVGTIHVRPGAAMAAQDEFGARVRGRGGHGAQPHTTRDPIVAAALAVTALQTVVSRRIDPLEPAVATVGRIYGGSAPNVIPDEVQLDGTLRSFDESTRAALREQVRQTLEHAVSAAGCELEFDLRAGFPAVINDSQAVERVRRAATAVVGDALIRESPPLTAAEDFAYFLEQRPGAFVLIGAGNEQRGISAPHHSPRFDFDEAALPIGAELLVRLSLSE